MVKLNASEQQPPTGGVHLRSWRSTSAFWLVFCVGACSGGTDDVGSQGDLGPEGSSAAPPAAGTNAVVPGAPSPGPQDPGVSLPGMSPPGVVSPPGAQETPGQPAVPGATPVPGAPPVPPPGVASPTVELPPQAGIEGRPSRAARLTNQQYRNTALDVLGVQLSDAQLSSAGLPADATHEDQFITWSGGQAFSAEHVKAYSKLARQIAEQLEPAATATDWAGCADLSPACADAVSAALGKRLLRRPLLPEEQQRMVQLFADVAGFDGATFADVAGAMFRAFLQSPQFLYRLESETAGTAGTTRGVSGYELASRLSYFLWQSAPDAALLEFAAQVGDAGGDDAAVAAQVERMLGDGRAARARETFWADYTLASQASYTGAQEHAEDLRRTVLASALRATGGAGAEVPLSELFTLKELVLSEPLAEALGLPDVEEGDQVYDVTAAPQRLGLFTHPGFVAGMGTESFVGRGKYLSERLLCYHITAPNLDDPGFQEQLSDAAEATQDFTPREAMEYRFGLKGACEVCHQTFEPVAFGFERFDIAGEYAEEDAQGRQLHTSGYLQDSAGVNVGDYADVPELMALLAGREEVNRCFVQNLLAFATGQEHVGTDNAAIDLAFANYQAAGGTFTDLAKAIAMSPQLRALKVAAPN